MPRFGELEAVIMDRLWTWGAAATVRDVYDDIHEERGIAYTTVMTVMDNLYRKGWLTRERDGKAWRYEPTASREEYTARLMHEALNGRADRTLTFAHFVEHMSDEESKKLMSALRRLTRKRKQ